MSSPSLPFFPSSGIQCTLLLFHDCRESDLAHAAASMHCINARLFMAHDAAQKEREAGASPPPTVRKGDGRQIWTKGTDNNCCCCCPVLHPSLPVFSSHFTPQSPYADFSPFALCSNINLPFSASPNMHAAVCQTVSLTHIQETGKRDACEEYVKKTDIHLPHPVLHLSILSIKHN